MMELIKMGFRGLFEALMFITPAFLEGVIRQIVAAYEAAFPIADGFLWLLTNYVGNHQFEATLMLVWIVPAYYFWSLVFTQPQAPDTVTELIGGVTQYGRYAYNPPIVKGPNWFQFIVKLFLLVPLWIIFWKLFIMLWVLGFRKAQVARILVIIAVANLCVSPDIAEWVLKWGYKTTDLTGLGLEPKIMAFRILTGLVIPVGLFLFWWYVVKNTEKKNEMVTIWRNIGWLGAIFVYPIFDALSVDNKNKILKSEFIKCKKCGNKYAMATYDFCPFCQAANHLRKMCGLCFKPIDFPITGMRFCGREGCMGKLVDVAQGYVLKAMKTRTEKAAEKAATVKKPRKNVDWMKWAVNFWNMDQGSYQCPDCGFKVAVGHPCPSCGFTFTPPGMGGSGSGHSHTPHIPHSHVHPPLPEGDVFHC